MSITKVYSCAIYNTIIGGGGFGDHHDHLTTTWDKFCLKTTMVVMVAIRLQNVEKMSNCTLKFE